ncbi:MAG: T9SS type A sorting domain-containing protein [Bacteroidia bacterium]|nr:T9SS type A sorting domain-containing protein [Bacteroidia bacterium]
MSWKAAAMVALGWGLAAGLRAQVFLPPSGQYVQRFDAYVPGEAGMLPDGWFAHADDQVLFMLESYSGANLPGLYHFAQNDSLGAPLRAGVGFVGVQDSFNPARLIVVIHSTENRENFRIRFRLSNLTGGEQTSFDFDYSPDGETFLYAGGLSGPGGEAFVFDLPEIADRPGPVYLRWTYQTQADTGDVMVLDSLSLSFDAAAPNLSVEIAGENSFCENRSGIFSAVVNLDWDDILWRLNGDTLAIDVETVEVAQSGLLELTVWADGDSATAQTTIATLSAPDGAAVLPGNQFQGSPGQDGQPDRICPNRTAQYRIQTPPGYSGAQFNQRWTYTYTLTDDLGQSFSGNVQTTNPSPNGDAFLRFTPSDAYLGRTLTLSIRYRDLQTGCVFQTERLLTVNGPLAPSVNLDTSVCIGVPVVIDPQVSAAAYLWSTGANTSTLVVSLPGNYWLRLTDENGCVSRTDFVVALRSGPQVDLGPNVNACQSHTLDAGPGASYLWSTGATTRQITVTAGGIYHVRVKDADGCEGRDTVAVVVNQPPTVVLPSQAGFCPGETVTLSTGNTEDAHFWSTGATSSTLTVGVAGTYTVRVTRGACEVVKSVEVSEYDPVVVNLGENVTACKPVVLDAGNIGAASYLWNTGAQTRAITVVQPGTYSVVVTNAQGCSATASVRVDFVPPLEVSLVGPDSAETGRFVDFSAVVTGGNPDFWYWDFGNGRLSNLPGNSYGFYRQPGVYTVTLVAGRDACRDTATRTLVVYGEPLGGALSFRSLDFVVYPNPVVRDAKISFRLNRPSSAYVLLTITDARGKVVERRQFSAMDLNEGYAMNAPAPGVYFVRLADETGAVQTAKIVVVE